MVYYQVAEAPHICLLQYKLEYQSYKDQLTGVTKIVLEAVGTETAGFRDQAGPWS